MTAIETMSLLHGCPLRLAAFIAWLEQLVDRIHHPHLLFYTHHISMKCWTLLLFILGFKDAENVTCAPILLVTRFVAEGINVALEVFITLSSCDCRALHLKVYLHNHEKCAAFLWINQSKNWAVFCRSKHQQRPCKSCS